MASIKNRRGEFYWVNDKPYISVTNILKVIDKPALRYWFGSEVYTAMIEKPNLSRQEALAAPWEKTKKAQDRGSTVHSIVESWKNAGEVVGLDGPYKGYAQAFQSWLELTGAKVIENERTVVSDIYGYAGTLDALVELGGKVYVLDVKTGKSLYPEVHLQLSAYQFALAEEGVVTDGTYALLLCEDGTYEAARGKESFKSFLAAMYLFRELNSDLLDKVAYDQQELDFDD